MSGQVASTPAIFSKARRTASLWNVPPCTTICFPRSLASASLMTLYSAFLITEYASPAEISETDAPSFCACLTLEFIKTVQRVPRSTGAFANKASLAKFSAVNPSEFAKFSMNEPHPEEQASLSNIVSTAPFLSLMHFIS